MERFHCGWLTKAPPENRMKRSFPFKSHWRRRFFVLYAPPSSTKSFTTERHAFLEYYDSESCVRRRGKPIDLNQCEELQDHLNSPYYRYLFSLRTPRRTYYLAAECESDMDVWVDKLTTICGFNSNEPVVIATPTPVPPPRIHNPLSPRPSLTPTNGFSSPPPPPPKTPNQNTLVQMESAKPSPAPKPKFSSPSFQSDTEPPALAPKQRHMNPALNDRNGDHPPSLTPKQRTQNAYTNWDNGVPPTPTPKLPTPYRNNENGGGGGTDGIYNRPTTQHHPDNSEGTMDETYCSPTSLPVHPDFSGGEDEEDRDGDYQYPSSYVVLPKQGDNGGDDARETYENMKTMMTGNPDGEGEREDTYDRLPSGRRPSKDDIYDFPSAKPVDTLPPPAAHQPVKIHGYVNAPSSLMGSPGYVNAPLPGGGQQIPRGCTVGSNVEGDADDFPVLPTNRTRSFKSRTSRSESSAGVIAKPPIARKPSNAEELEDEDSDTD